MLKSNLRKSALMVVALPIIEDLIEEQISCNATLQDNFEYDTVLVALKKNVSLQFKDYIGG